MGYASSLAPAIDSLVQTQYAHLQTKVFELAGSTHTMLGSFPTFVGPGAVKLSDWVHQWATGEAAWATLVP